MSAYDKINSFNARAIRKLSDYHILTQGRMTQCTRLYCTTDMWGNTEGETISVSSVPVIFVFPPGELPLIRLKGRREDGVKEGTGLYFYDVLPTEIYTRWEDKIEVGDVLYFFAKDEAGEKIPVVFKVLSEKGSFSTELIWRKMLAAPITDIDREIPGDLKKQLLADLKEENDESVLNSNGSTLNDKDASGNDNAIDDSDGMQQ